MMSIEERWERSPAETTLEAGSIQMAADEIGEGEALEWANGLIGDVADDPD
jgi:hypothetical protein